MVSMDSLIVWLSGEPVAQFDRHQNGRLSLAYLESAFERYDLASPVLSVSLPPITDQRFPFSVDNEYFCMHLARNTGLGGISSNSIRSTSATHLERRGADAKGETLIAPAGRS